MPTFSRSAQLITYPDSLGGSIAAIEQLLAGPMRGWFPGGVHLLPPYPSSGDRGFAPLTHLEIDPAFGTWADVERLATHGGLTLDVMVNHLSRHAPEFRDFLAHGRASRWADLFITLDKVWPDGNPPPEDVAAIFLRKPEHPFSDVVVGDTGRTERVWSSFGPRVDVSEQVDLDVWSPRTRALLTAWFTALAGHGVTEARLDAVGYVVKRAGTSCFMVEPEIWTALDALRARAEEAGLAALPEIHAHPDVIRAVTEHGHPVYDFVLPGLLLDALRRGRTERLMAHLAASPPDQVTMLDCHDGIPVHPDLDGVVPGDDLAALVADVERRGGNINRLLGAAPRAPAADAHQLNITYPSAVGDQDGYLVARAVQVFARGRPQVYYVGLLGGVNDDEAVGRTGEGRAINRHDFTADEIAAALATEVVARQARLLDLRARHRAFAGELTVASTGASGLAMRWAHGDHWCELRADVATRRARVTECTAGGAPITWAA